MSDNKFIERLKGKDTSKSILEINNEAAKTSFANMPSGTSNAIDVYSDHRADATAVLNGTTNWKISNSNLILANDVTGDGADFSSTYSVSGAGLWIDSVYTFPSTGDPAHPVAMVFNPSTKWVLKVCGDNLIVDGGYIADFTLLVKIGTSNVFTKTFSIAEQAGPFCKEFVLDFNETNAGIIKASGLSTLTVQLLCGTANASARIYNGMTILTCLQRKVDASAVSNLTANVDDLLNAEMIPVEYFSNAEFIDQIEDGEQAYAVFERDGDNVNLAGWTPKDEVARKDEIIVKSATMPTASADLLGAVYQYTGVTSAPYEHGYIYECKETSPGVYGWERIDVQPGGSRGRFLALWNCATGLAESNPPYSPYEYKTGDYFIVDTVSSATPAVNYKPDGSSYTTGIPSTTLETGEVAVDDTYFYDGTTWKLQSNSNKTVTFSNISGDIYDNASATTALNAKQNTLVSGINIKTINSTSLLGSGNININGLPAQAGNTGKYLTTNGSTASWATVDALPTQTGNSGKLLTTNGTSASWTEIKTINSGSLVGSGNINVLVNEATATNALGVGYTTINTTYNDSINIGNASQVLANNAIALGAFASAEGQDSIAIYSSTGTAHRARTTHTGNIAIGYNALAINAAYTIAIGYNAFAQGTNSIQLGTGNVSSQNTFQVWTYPMLNKTTGLIPAARLADQTSATQGQVLTLDANLDAVWANGGGGSVNIDNLTITKNGDDEIQAVATVNANTAVGATNPVYDWVGTLAEYTSQAVAINHPDWVCYITDDAEATAYQAYTQGQTNNLLAGKVDKGHQVVEFQEPTSTNNYTWYRKYADGWVEQGSFATNLAWNGYGAQSVITLPIVMKDSNYTVCATMSNNNSSWNYPGCRGWADSATQIIVGIATLGNDQGTVYKVYWQVSGMAA